MPHPSFPVRFWILSLVLAGIGTAVSRAGDESTPYRNEEIGVSFRLPSSSWRESDRSQGTVRVILFSPDVDFSTRASLLRLPAGLLPEGMRTREEQIEATLGKRYARVSLAEATLGGRGAERLEYTAARSRTIEYGVPDAGAYLIFQVSAPEAAWRDDATRARLEGIVASFDWLGARVASEAPEIDRSTSDEIRARRRLARYRPERSFEVSHHDLHVTLDPEEGSLLARDRLTVRALEDGCAKVSLMCSHVSVVSMESPAEITWKASEQAADDGRRTSLTVELAAPLAEGADLALEVVTASDDFLQATDQTLVEEIAILGQVRERSSFSSHVMYYPIDRYNDASVEIALTVPDGYTAVSGGDAAGKESAGGRTTFRYRTDHRVERALPFGFAVGRYLARSARSEGGLELTVYGYEGEEKLVEQRLDAAVECASLFERMMGPLPWKSVRLAHVTPLRKETGVSPPGLILVSDRFFGDLEGVDLSDGNLSRPDVLGLLVVADELSHQWNLYTAPFPNELAEGVSTFTNALFAESRHGQKAYRAVIRQCADAYRTTIAVHGDVAVADPLVYRSAGYRGIVFCKTPVILDMLRTRLGDELFFAAWRRAFRSLDRDREGFDVLAAAFSEESGRDLAPFFEQWFFRAGCPRIDTSFEAEGDEVRVTLTQTQEGAPYELLAARLELRGASGERALHRVELGERETVVRLPRAFEVIEVVFDPDDRLLTR